MVKPGQAFALTVVNFIAFDPFIEGLWHAADLGGDRFNSCPTLDIRHDALAPCAQRVRGLPGKTCLITCSWLHLLKGWGLLKIRGASTTICTICART